VTLRAKLADLRIRGKFRLDPDAARQINDGLDLVIRYMEADPTSVRAVANLLAVVEIIQAAKPTAAEIAWEAERHGIRGAARRLGMEPSTVHRRVRAVPSGTPTD
jgi:hypothetical protein